MMIPGFPYKSFNGILPPIIYCGTKHLYAKFSFENISLSKIVPDDDDDDKVLKTVKTFSTSILVCHQIHSTFFQIFR